MLQNMSKGFGEVKQSEALCFDLLNHIIQLKRVQAGRVRDGLNVDAYMYGKAEALAYSLLAASAFRLPHLGELERLQEVLDEVKKMESEKKKQGLTLKESANPSEELAWKGSLEGYAAAKDTINKWIGNPTPQGINPILN